MYNESDGERESCENTLVWELQIGKLAVTFLGGIFFQVILRELSNWERTGDNYELCYKC